MAYPVGIFQILFIVVLYYRLHLRLNSAHRAVYDEVKIPPCT